MTEEELRKQIFLILDNSVDWDFEKFYDMDVTIKEILTLIREAGWKSEEEVEKLIRRRPLSPCWCGQLHDPDEHLVFGKVKENGGT